jgi:hypothetical protein
VKSRREHRGDASLTDNYAANGQNHPAITLPQAEFRPYFGLASASVIPLKNTS